MRLGQLDIFDAQELRAQAGSTGRSHWVNIKDAEGENILTFYFNGAHAGNRARNLAKAINDAQQLVDVMETFVGDSEVIGDG